MNNDTNPMFAKFDQALGVTTPTSSGGPVSSRAAEIRALANPSATSADTSPGYMQSVADTMKQGANDSAGALTSAGTDVVKNWQDYNTKNQGADPITKVLNAAVFAGHTAGDIAKGTIGMAGGTIKAAAAPLTQARSTTTGQTFGDAANKGVVQPVQDAASALSAAHPEVVKWLADQAAAHPDIAKSVGDIVNTLGLVGGGKVLGGEVTPVSDAISATKNAASDSASAVQSSVAKITGNDARFGGVPADTVANAAKTAETSDNLTKIQDIIAPKLNAKEVRAAVDEGRVTRGKESVIFGKQPDIVAQSDEVKQAAQTIADNIPNAHTMDDVQLDGALASKTEEMAKNLQGEMASMTVKPATTGKVVSAWKDLKAEQAKEPEFDAFAGSTKSQAKFESYLKQLQWDITDEAGKFKSPTPKSLDDIWNTRKEYDASIPANVKNATEQSHPNLQWQKTMWLQNRALLNSAIHDTTDGLGAESKKAFSDMSDMYMARENILSKAKLDTEGSHGVLPGNKKQLLKWGLTVGGGAIGADILLRKVGL